MLDLISEMMRTPDAQIDPYIWGAALLGHFAIGVFLTAILGWIVGAWRGAVITIAAYSLAWEGAQLLLFESMLADSFVDALAVTCGAVVAAGSWRQRGAAVGAAMAVLAIVGARGVTHRRKSQQGEDI